MCGDRQTVFNFAGTGTTKFSGGLFEWNAGGDGQTVTKFSGGLF